MARKKQTYIKGTFTHRRTERDYMGVMLDAVTLDDWRDVVQSTVVAAKSGDPSARSFLAQYLVGRPEMKAPAPLTVVVQQLSGNDPLVDRLAHSHIHAEEYPPDNWKEHTKDRVAAELQVLEAQKSNKSENGANADGKKINQRNEQSS